MSDQPTITPDAVAPETAAAPATPPQPTDRMAAIREKARAKAEMHDITSCLCPYCRGRRKREGIPNPPSAPRTAKPPAAEKSKPTDAITADPSIIHDRDHCPCPGCSEWRSERARKAALAKHAKAADTSYDWLNEPIDAAERHLADMRLEIERGAKIIQQRHSTASLKYVKCEVCKKDILNGRWVQARTIRDPHTNLQRNIFLCSTACVAQQSYNPAQRGPTSGEPTGFHPEQGVDRGKQ